MLIALASGCSTVVRGIAQVRQKEDDPVIYW